MARPTSPQFHILSSAQIAARRKPFLSDDLIFNHTTKELRMGPGPWGECLVLIPKPGGGNSSSDLVWEGFLSQSGTNPPTVKVLTNTLGGTPVLSYVDAGIFIATLEGAFPIDRTSSFLGPVTIQSVVISGQVLEIQTIDQDNLSIMTGVVGSNGGDNDILDNTYFKITVKQ